MKKSTLIFIGLVVIAAVAYFYFMGNKTPEDSGSLQAQNNPEVEIAASRVFSLLNQIKSLKIDTAMFASPAYQTLRDYSVEIPPQNVGRANPFAPIPGVPSQSASNPRR